MAFYITRTDSGHLEYSNGTAVGNISASALGIQIKEGVGNAYPFGLSFSPRMLDMIVHYTIENPSGTSFSWGQGGSGGNIIVSPNSTTIYSLTISKDGCSDEAATEVEVSGLGSVEEITDFTSIYPNPASNSVFIKVPNYMTELDIEITDLSGKSLLKNSKVPENGLVEIPLYEIFQGVYFISIKNDNIISRHKLQVLN